MMLSSTLLFVVIISGILISFEMCCFIIGVNGSTTTDSSSSSSSSSRRRNNNDDDEKCNTGAENNNNNNIDDENTDDVDVVDDDGTSSSSCAWKKKSQEEAVTTKNNDNINNNNNQNNNHHHHHDDNEDCTLVVAPSTIPNAGLGIYTLKDLQPDQQVGESDLVIPMKELVLIKKHNKNTNTNNNIIFEDYTWSGRIYSGGKNDAFAPGLQSLSNSHLGLFNIFPQPAKLHNTNIDGWISTNDDSTFYHGVKTFVGSDSPIPAGGELFAMYGDHWFEGRSLIKKGGSSSSSSSSSKDYYTTSATTSATTTTTTMMMMASSDDYYIAEELAKMFQTKFGDDESTTYSYNNNNNNNNNQYPLYWPVDLWHVVEDFIRIWNGHPAANILPDYSQLRQTQQLGIRSIYQSMVTQDVEELRHAMTVVGTARCVDSIRPGPSKIHNQGGFAKRNYNKGSIITGSPLLHSDIKIWNPKRTAWDPTTETYITADETKNNNNNNNDDDDDDDNHYYTMYQNHALLINYCWSHRNSSILLCPYAPGVSYINHASPRLINNKKGEHPNVQIQWAPNGQLSHNDDAFRYSPDDLVNNFTNKVSLAIDYVALRDIAEGEELTIDYGMEWEKARHYFQQQKHNIATSEAILRRYNEQALLKTEVEQLSDPYPDDIVLKCMAQIMYSTSLPTEGDDETMWKQAITQQKQSSSPLLDCSVLERQQVKISDGSTRIVYAVRVFYEGSWKGRAGIPRRYIRWFFANDNNNQHTKVFRFPMQLPDEMVPAAWKDIVR